MADEALHPVINGEVVEFQYNNHTQPVDLTEIEQSKWVARYEYEIVELAADKLPGFLEQKNFDGINVTIPYKQAVIPYLDEISDSAKEIGAVNTIVNRNGKLTGYNTDASGLKMLMNRAGADPAGRTVMIAGSGGTSRTAPEPGERNPGGPQST